MNTDGIKVRERYLDVRRGTEDKCDCTGYVFCFQTLKGREKRYY